MLKNIVSIAFYNDSSTLFFAASPAYLGISPVVWVILAAAGLATIAAFLIRRTWQRKTRLDLPEEFGFDYDPARNLFYSTLDAWQRRFGYCELYDEAAPPLGMIIDCEPVRFDYDGKHWLIEFWKGQYGITTGAEIGVYYTDGPSLLIPGAFDGTFYDNTDTELKMTMQLYKDGRKLFSRHQRHWWLTGFIPGEFSHPGELTLLARVTCKDVEMREAFVAALEELGYGAGDLEYSGSTVLLTITMPKSRQPATRTVVVEQAMLKNNRHLCEVLQDAVGGLENAQEQLALLRETNPGLYSKVVRSSRSASALFAPYESIRKTWKERRG